MLSRITGREYLQLQCHAREIRIKDFDKHNLFDLPLDKYAENYSSGMMKKLAITAILLRKNQIFILDEPFNGVDIHSNMVITDIIHKLRELQKLVIISSHIFATLTDTCDQLLLLKDGKISMCADKHGFLEIENEMRGKSIGDRIERMHLG
jgi:ABC-2 type transport system ATP-binding protein